MGDFKQLVVWRRAHGLALRVYRAASGFPATERFELSSQVRRAAVSISANLAEGTGRLTDGDQARLYQTALGSARELECLLLMARDLGFLRPEDHQALASTLDEIERMLVALVRRSRATASALAPRR